jgi:hypothetical protein
MHLLLPIAGAAFILVALVVTIRHLVESQPHSKSRRAMWGTLGQLGAVAIFLALATAQMRGGSTLFRLELIALALTAINVVVTLVISKRRAKSSA